MTAPLVSVICLCHNQRQFIRESIESVLHQTYKPVQLIVVDDASTDGSVEEIQKLKADQPQIEVVLLNSNVGNCKAFNAGLQLAKGDYLIDLAADDVLMPTRIEEGVRMLQHHGNSYGVNFSDAQYINEDGAFLYQHSERFPHDTIPQGDIYENLVKQYFICSPTVLFSRAVIQQLGGYDESLAYEDFDFWIRSSRTFKYCYSSKILVKKRITTTAMTRKQFQLFSKHSLSTFRVCEKILALNRTRKEQRALTARILYEMKLNMQLLNMHTVWKFLMLLVKNRKIRYAG